MLNRTKMKSQAEIKLEEFEHRLTAYADMLRGYVLRIATLESAFATFREGKLFPPSSPEKDILFPKPVLRDRNGTEFKVGDEVVVVESGRTSPDILPDHGIVKQSTGGDGILVWYPTRSHWYTRSRYVVLWKRA